MAHWRLMSWPVVHCSHTVHRLRVYNEDGAAIIFDEGDEAAAMEEAEAQLETPKDNMLTAFFKKCANPETVEQLIAMKAVNVTTMADTLLYENFNDHYWYNWSKREWFRRKKNYTNQISRIFTVSVRNTETFAIRCLLLHKRGKSIRPKISSPLNHPRFRPERLGRPPHSQRDHLPVLPSVRQCHGHLRDQCDLGANLCRGSCRAA